MFFDQCVLSTQTPGRISNNRLNMDDENRDMGALAIATIHLRFLVMPTR
jgi:hypothetical protein